MSSNLVAQTKNNRDDIDNKIKKLKAQSDKDRLLIDSLILVKNQLDIENALLIEKKIDSLKHLRNEVLGKDEHKKNPKLSFVVGIGYSNSLNTVYNSPIVSDYDNKVKIEKGQKARISANFGIVYTPYSYLITDHENPDGYSVPWGISYVAFFNPLSLVRNSNLEENFNLGNFGLGVGFKTASGIGIYAVGELFSVKQPRKWFIDEFQNGDKEYKINGQIQTSFNESDNKIFTNKLIPSLGIKICYSFDLIRSFATLK